MQSGSLVCIIVICSTLIAGCIQMPGMHVLSNSPDPIIGQWIGGEPPASDLHIIFFENQTFFSTNFFLGSGQSIDTGNWTKKEPGRYSMQSSDGETSEWVYDSFFDLLNMNGLPQMKYYRYKG